MNVTAPTQRTRQKAERPARAKGEIALTVYDLFVEFATERGTVHAVNGVSFCARAGETIAIVGESGSGKSVTAQTIMGTLPRPPAEITRGTVRFEDTDLITLPRAKLRRLLGSHISMVTQDALTALNPTLTVGFQIAEMYRVHWRLSRAEAKARAIEMLERVRIPDAAARARQYPHQFSGGMQQRAMIAMALALEPEVVIADEPTTALDVTVQAQIMDLLLDLQTETGMALVLITHDLALVSDVADTIAIMYGGRIVESGPVREVFARPAHPYTRGLMTSVPGNARRAEDLRPIPGRPPDLLARPTACAFAPRCDRAVERCHTDLPSLAAVAGTRMSACHLAHEEYAL